ncbi:fungal-specific transcription factor domain-containing protein [Aspergillus coremiiformis]|uniref:Fungal-specific transcription factor domain-containing protein n=1 Tax=Aspergillus coremiiformis TaxID=138285 RepID=A0A5N6Z9K4_9EURO|nr:fungal-specific transcription factor domain-containing protein [Aspergillus coremiiformis]
MGLLSQGNLPDEQAQTAAGTPYPEVSIPTVLRDSFVETFFTYCYWWCPVIDPELLTAPSAGAASPLLQYALALCGTRIKPPLLPSCDSPDVYYERAKGLIYNHRQDNPLLLLASISLFNWWSVGAPNRVNIDGAWWWTGIAIRMAQQMGLHREPSPHQVFPPGETVGLRRRIWWTLFARDRILSISQGRPTMIDLDFCTVKMVTAGDFPDPTDPKVDIFISWINLCEISGRISKELSRGEETRMTKGILSHELRAWIKSVPKTISMPPLGDRISRSPFDRDVHRLHLTYLANMTLLHLTPSSQSLPKASKTGMIAASCMARLLEENLARGCIRFYSGEVGWEIAIGLLALLCAKQFENLRRSAEADIRVMCTALDQMAFLWPSSRMFATVFHSLLTPDQPPPDRSQYPAEVSLPADDLVAVIDAGGIPPDITDFIPFVTPQTSPLIGQILSQDLTMPDFDFESPVGMHEALLEFLPSLTDSVLFSYP